MISFSYYRFCWKEMYWKWNLVFEFRSFRMDKFYNLRSNGCPFEARICPCDPIWIFCYSIDSCNYYIFCIQVCVAEDKFFENNLHFYANAKSFPHFIFLQSIESSTNCHPQKFICLPIAILRFYDYIQMCHILAIYSRFESSSTVWKCWFVYYWRLSTGIV